MEVGAGATSRASNRGDNAFGGHVIPHLGFDLFGMAVKGGIAVSVIEDYYVAISAYLTRVDHFSVA